MIYTEEWRSLYINTVEHFMNKVLGEVPYRWCEEEEIWERRFFADREKYKSVALSADEMLDMLLEKSGFFDEMDKLDEAEKPYYDKYYEEFGDSIPTYNYEGPDSVPWDYSNFQEYQTCVDKGLIKNPMTRQEFENLVRKLDNLPDDEQLSEKDLDRYCRRK